MGLVAHENQHHKDFYDEVWGGLMYDSSLDTDRDGLRDDWERAIDQSCAIDIRNTGCDIEGLFKPWTEDRAKRAQEGIEDYCQRDWGAPGCQY